MSVNVYENVLNDEELSFILTHSLTISSRELLTTNNNVIKFYIKLPITIKNSLKNAIGLDLYNIKDVPMRWIKGDTKPHIDMGEDVFLNTYLIYVTDSTGNLIINSNEYNISRGKAFVFNEGLAHETKNTENNIRLMIGPMSESGFVVGGVFYFFDYQGNNPVTNIDSGTNLIMPGLSYIETNFPLDYPFYIPPNGKEFSGWIVTQNIGSNFAPEIGTMVYPGDLYDWDSNLGGTVNLQEVLNDSPCFLEDTKILCFVDNEEKYMKIQDIKPGVMVKTNENGYKSVDMIGHSKIYNSGNNHRSKNRLYKCSKDKYPELNDDLYITGCHSILVDNITSVEREKIIEFLGNVYITGKKYRLIACVDERTEPYNKEGVFNIWHIALENDNYYNNYGIYANGLLVESISKRYLKELSGMTLVL